MTTQRQNHSPSRQLAEKHQSPGRTRSAPVGHLAQAEPLALQRAVAYPLAASPAEILALQRMAGNQAVVGLIQRKLTVNAPGDLYEREADRVAEHVVASMGSPVGQPQTAQRQGEEEEVQTKPLAIAITPVVQRAAEEEEEVQTKRLVQRQAEEEEEVQTKRLVQRQAEEEEEVQTERLVQRQAEEEEEVQTKRQVPADGSFEASAALEHRLAGQAGGGAALSEDVRADLEPRLGADLSGVRIHTGGEAAQLNRELSSRAFTHGQDIYFREGEYSPEAPSGRRLLSHELAHTLQQGAARRIAGWWPKGHRLVTEQAMKEGGFEKWYSSGARGYLIDRSPDIDFITDGLRTMQAGRAASQKKLVEYRKLLASKEPEDRKRARQMYDDNELHIREESYMDNHGEGGYYKRPGASKNEGVTAKYVSKAVALWKSGNPLQSLSALSDALHQAEDRGSHGEGDPFDGHDVRLTLGTEEWEKEHYDPTWEPDNIAVNSRGAVLAVGFAEGLLTKFKNDIGLGEGKKISTPAIGKFFKPKRRLYGFIKSDDAIAHMMGDTGLGKTGGIKKLAEIFSKQLEDPEVKKAYEAAKKEPKEQSPLLHELLGAIKERRTEPETVGVGRGVKPLPPPKPVTGRRPQVKPEMIEELKMVLKQKQEELEGPED